jgi:glycine hydroxymethyltransferase
MYPTNALDWFEQDNAAVAALDPQLYQLLLRQAEYEATTLKLIPSENYVGDAVRRLTGSILTNKYSEGYPGARYYEGNEIVDEIEDLARKCACSVFKMDHANVQPLSGAPANQAAFRALASNGDTIMGLPVPSGGHLTHGWPVNFSGTDYRAVHYHVDPATGLLDFENIRRVALAERPRVIVAGATAYPRQIDFGKFREIADEAGAYLLADISHISGLIAVGLHASPAGIADVITTTTHKMLRGPRAAIILCREDDRFAHDEKRRNLARRIDRAVFPLIQAGPHMNTIAAIAATLSYAQTGEYLDYARAVLGNARALADALLERGFKLVTGGTDNHLMVLDLRDRQYSGKQATKALSRAGVITNFNMVPNDPRPPSITSGIRLGTPAITAIRMRPSHMADIARFIFTVLERPDDERRLLSIRASVAEFMGQFAIPGVRSPAVST